MATQIQNIEGLTIRDLQNEVDRGGKFVVFSYTISILVMTFKNPTDIYFVRADESALKHSWPYLLLTLVAGWWGIPWGPIYSLWSIGQAFGGKDITLEVMNALRHDNNNNLSDVEVAPELLEQKK
jgi:hypothetical protein